MSAEEPETAAPRHTDMRILVVPLAVLVLSGCGAGPRACTAMGALEGITVEFPDSIALRQGFVALEVCDEDGCADLRQSLGRIRPGTPPARSFAIEFDALGRRFGPGTVTAAAEVLDAGGTPLATARRDVELAPTYPNGEECDGDGFVSGTLTLSEDDLVSAGG